MPAQQHFDASRHFVGIEGLGEIVIPTGPQAPHSLIRIRQGADHQHRRLYTVLAQARDYGQAVHAGEHAIQRDRVIKSPSRALQPGGAVAHPLRVQAVALQLGADFISGHAIVFDDEYSSHGSQPRLSRNRQRTAPPGEGQLRSFM